MIYDILNFGFYSVHYRILRMYICTCKLQCNKIVSIIIIFLFFIIALSIYLQEKDNVKNDKLSIEHYIASKILRSSDAANTQKYSVTISLIQHLLQIDSELDKQMKNNLNLVSTNIVPCDILESVESTSKNKQVNMLCLLYVIY